MKKVFFVVLLCSALAARAQENVSRDFISLDPKAELKVESASIIAPTNSFKLDYNLLSPEFLVNPGSYQPNLDFKGKIYNLKSNFSYMLYSNKDMLHGFGGSLEAGGLFLYQPFDNLTSKLLWSSFYD